MSNDSPGDRRRRDVLRTIGATTAAVGLTGVAAGQDDEDEETANGDFPIILAGEASQWVGLTPASILAEENPTLELEAGEEYEIVWINIDGTIHNVAFLDEDEEELETSDDAETPGETVSMTFEATEDMTEYYCEYHPDDMRGDVEIGDGFDLSEFGDVDGEDGEDDD